MVIPPQEMPFSKATVFRTTFQNKAKALKYWIDKKALVAQK